MGFPRWGFSYGWRHSVFDYLLLLRGRSYKKGGRQSAVSRQKESGFGDPSYKKGGQQSVVVFRSRDSEIPPTEEGVYQGAGIR